MFIHCIILDFKHFTKAPDESQDQIVGVEKSLPQMVEETEESNVYDKLRIFSSLTQFQVKIFKGEPKLVSNASLFSLSLSCKFYTNACLYYTVLRNDIVYVRITVYCTMPG